MKDSRKSTIGPSERSAADPSSSTPPSKADKRLLERCCILLVALVLTEPMTNKAQQDEIAKLIKALKKRIGYK
jgi:hypothetical protein